MEGYLFKKGRGQSGFLGRKNWKRRWCVLEGQFLTYYEDFNKKTQKPTDKKGMVPVRGCTVELINNKEKNFQFVLKHETRDPLFMSADDEKIMKTWITALERAAKSLHDGPVSIDFTEYYQIFGLNMADNPTASQINRAYRKTCLKCHPDKGGDPNEFKRVQEAFEILTSKLEEEEEDKLYKTIYFDTVIEKGPPGVGFGMVVAEIPNRQVIFVKDVLKTMNLKSISEEGRGAVAKGDILVKIGDDDITGWTLTRLVQRLNDFRVPVNTDVQLRFSRRVKIVEDEPQPSGDFGDIDEGEPVGPPYSQPEAPQDDGPSAPPVYTPGEPGGMNDIDEDTYVPSASSGQGNAGSAEPPMPPPQSNGWFDGVDDDEEPPEDNQSDRAYETAKAAAESAYMPEEEFYAAEGDWEDVMDNPARRATIESAGEDLQAEFTEMSNTLKDVIAQRDKLKMELDEMKEIIRHQKSEKKALLKQLELAEQDCEGAESREADAVLQLKEISYQNQQSKEEVSQMVKDSAHVASLLKRSKDIPVPREFEVYLDRNGYAQGNLTSPVVMAQRTALRTAAAVDKNGSVLRKWSLEGDSAVDKIRKFEAKLARQEQQSRQQRGPDKPDMKDFTSPGFDEINSQLGMHAQPHEFDENMINMNQEVDGVDYDEYMQRVLNEQQAAPAPAPRRAPPARPAPRVDMQSREYSGRHAEEMNDNRYDRAQHQQNPSQGFTPSPRFAPNPLFSSTASSPASGGKIMGLLERKLANRSTIRPAPRPGSLQGHSPAQRNADQSGRFQRIDEEQNRPYGQQYPNVPANAINGAYPSSFRDDYSEGSGSFGWGGLAH